MRYHVLAADYDGTLAHHGRIDDATWAALHRLVDSGRKVVMVTGRELDDVLALLREPGLFVRIVAENGALVYDPATREVRLLAEPPPPRFVDELRARGVDQLAAGRVIVATREPHQDTVLHAIRDLGLELQVIFNKGAVMVLPSGVNKATGLAAALGELGLSPHNAAGIGDAENDHALLVACECGVAVANALPALKDKADLVTAAGDGDGVAELIDQLIAEDLAGAAPRLARHRIEIGASERAVVSIDPYAANLMVCGTSGSGKSTLTTSLLERLCKSGYQFAIVDPEGDYASLELAVVLGGQQREPLVEEVIDVVRDPSHNVVVNLLGVAASQRPECFGRLLAALREFRARTGRPHWLVVDEAHHVLPAAWEPANDAAAAPPRGMIYVTVHPGSVAPVILKSLDTLLVVGERPHDTVIELCRAAELAVPRLREIDRLPPGCALYWKIGDPAADLIRVEPPRHERTRHSRKYAEGNLGNARSFYFRGRDGKLNLRAQNLMMFLQLGDGVDDDTWQHHREQRDYSTWLRDEVKDDPLAREVETIERSSLNAADSRAAIRAAIEKRYTLPADDAVTSEVA
ncbi:MAG: HAD-IIB family hydrolase [Deltaproteobacteria bacterium]|nr:MAG: HAD-IIB family hydrolase [Deltaproteobacteria bacterium]TMQ19870.1 MAG: HAD-IIB family hydrolase [Deltaproteobacteria bacterium]